MRDQSGQASLEYVVIVAIVSVLLTGSAALTRDSGIASVVVAQFARAICVVSGGDCDRDRMPCVVQANASSTTASLVIAVIKLSGGRTLIRERRSDGTELVTLIENGGAGVELTAGARLSLGAAQFGAALVGSVTGSLVRGRAWVVPDSASAERLVAQIVLHATPMTGLGRRPSTPPSVKRIAAPPPDITFGERGLDSVISGQLSAAGVSFDAEDLVGERFDHRSGQRTLTIRRRNELQGDISPLPASGVEGSLRHTELYTLSFDREGKMIDLGVFDARRFLAGAKLPRPLAALIESSSHRPLRSGLLVEVEQHLDLNGAENRSAAVGFIDSLRRQQIGFGPAAAISQRLRDRIESSGVTLTRSYQLSEEKSGLGGRVGAAVGVGLEVGRSTESASLRDAQVRGIDGNWRRRDDCLAAR